MPPVHLKAGALVVAGLGMAIPLMTRAADAPRSDAGELEEIIVTATKRAERALDVPVSISVIGAGELERLHVTSLQELTAAAPGLIALSGGSVGQTSIILRGLPALNSGSLVATVIDDSAVGSSAAWADESSFELDMLPYDIERIEILRGPQGTLYGANSMGGVLKYVTKYPSLTTTEAQVGGETFTIKGGGTLGASARAMYSMPLVDGTLAVRGSLYGQQTPGYIENPLRGLNHENSLSQSGGRLAMLWQPATDLQVKLQGIYQRTASDGNANTFARLLGTPQDAYYRPGNWLDGDLTYRHVIPEPFSSNLKFISGSLDWRMAFADLISVSSYSDKLTSGTQDFSAVLGYLQPMLDPNVTSTLSRARFDVSVKRFSQELRLTSASGQRLEWLVGAYYSHEKATNNQYVDALDGQLELIPALNPFFAAHIPSSYDEAAVFGTSTYRITDRFYLTAGLRWLTNRQTLAQEILPGGFIPASQSASRSSETPTTYAFGARFRLQPDTMVYLRVASGYRPGTPNSVLPAYPQIPPQTNSDTMVNYEIGLKSELMKRKAAVELAAFKINWSDMQLDIFTPDGHISYATNAGKVTSEGFEFAASYWPTNALRLEANAAYSDAYATEAAPAASIFVGTRLPSSPKWTAAATIEYRMRDWNQWTPQLSATWRYIAAQYSTLSTNPPLGVVPDYSWVDVDLRMVKGRYSVSLYAKNLLDKRAFNFGGPVTDSTTGASSFEGVPILPRVVGLSASVRL